MTTSKVTPISLSSLDFAIGGKGSLAALQEKFSVFCGDWREDEKYISEMIIPPKTAEQMRAITGLISAVLRSQQVASEKGYPYLMEDVACAIMELVQDAPAVMADECRTIIVEDATKEDAIWKHFPHWFRIWLASKYSLSDQNLTRFPVD